MYIGSKAYDASAKHNVYIWSYACDADYVSSRLLICEVPLASKVTPTKLTKGMDYIFFDVLREYII